MADVTLVQSGSNNGTTTPATPGSLTLTANNLAVLIIAARGTSPTLTTPTNWTQVQKTSGASVTFALYALLPPNNTGGATNPSSTIGGTVTGWIASMFELNTGLTANEGLVSSAQSAQSTAALTNVFPGASLSGQNLLFFYSVARLTATLTSPVSGLNWSASVQSQAGVQGLSTDSFWASSFAQGGGPFFSFPVGAGTLGSAVASVQIGAWFNANPTGTVTSDIIGGFAGVYVPQFYQGMIGG